ncbi:5-formyltetrahydrofolate cyclo-ligase [Arthrobacter gandavensis]|uniref:5-formyltetrahydrofolate cyclo-ligase n=1 Tax=Arthrobacter gandavensis TaxID=169960 RepID=UPI00188E17B8|nr:5-formyltetrahydrofolate cyclo-ligase [Arthrobacter gandavensis]MBF4993803.1 5-formyltetrahydrofolate cyclo-ligase [Arthrobacter gandavensis]
MTGDTKEQVRSNFRQKRRALRAWGSAQQLSSAAAPLLRALEPGSMVSCYLSTGTEPDTSALLAALVDAGHTVVVPVCEPGYRLSWCPWIPGGSLVPGLFPGIPEPAGPRWDLPEIMELNLLLIPALAASSDGTRMGKGGGYYDRFLTRYRAAGGTAPVVAVVHDHEFVPAGGLPADALDVPVDGVLRPAGYTGVRQ